MDGYKQETRELVEKVTPNTPLEVRYEREHQAIEQTDLLALEFKAIKELYERVAQLWKSLAEDERIHKLDQKEENLNATIQDIKQKKKTILISKRLRSTQEMKNLEEEEKEI